VNRQKRPPVPVPCSNQFDSFVLGQDHGIHRSEQRAKGLLTEMPSEKPGYMVVRAMAPNQVPQIQTERVTGFSRSRSQRSPAYGHNEIAREVFEHVNSFGVVAYPEASS